MVKWTEEDHAAHMKRHEATGKAARKLPERVCLLKSCGKTFTPSHHNRKCCIEACSRELKRVTANAINKAKRAAGIDPKKKLNKPPKQALLPPIDDGKGIATVCPDCGGKYDETKHGAPQPRNRRQGAEIIGGIAYDWFICLCEPNGHRYYRYTGEDEPPDTVPEP